MRSEVLMPLALLLIAQGAPSSAQNAAAAEESRVTVEEGAPLTVECALSVAESAWWRLDGAAPPGDLRAAGEAAAGGRVTARLHAAQARAHHAGVYTCARVPAQRVRVLVRARSLPAPGEPAAAAASTAAPAEPATAAAATAAAAAPVFYYNLTRSFELNCTQSAADGYVWTVNGTALADVKALGERAVLSQGGALLTVRAKTLEDDFGKYACAAAGGAVLRTWDVHGIPYAKLPPNTNVVEGQKLKLVCKLFGKPYPTVSWLYSPPGTDTNATDVSLVPGLAARVQLAPNEQGVAGAVLVLAEAAHADAGNYTCVPAGGASIAASTELRVKGMYAALWPFLGICAEVFVLCAIILVYEKRRTKPELDDSDTDNHDQKKS